MSARLLISVAATVTAFNVVAADLAPAAAVTLGCGAGIVCTPVSNEGMMPTSPSIGQKADIVPLAAAADLDFQFGPVTLGSNQEKIPDSPSIAENIDAVDGASAAAVTFICGAGIVCVPSLAPIKNTLLEDPTSTVTNSASLSAVPLPAALPLFASGLGVLGLVAWRRKRKAAALVVA
jgi:hypothetical protein